MTVVFEALPRYIAEVRTDTLGSVSWSSPRFGGTANTYAVASLGAASVVRAFVVSVQGSAPLIDRCCGARCHQ